MLKILSLLKKTSTLLNSTKKCHTKEVRVRFAPSPTGYLHLGGLRTALYNYFFAKANKGKFIIRIEDTDQSRIIKGATEQLLDDLNWCKIKVDEGPLLGGNYGPYIQSERLSLYKKEVEKLLGKGHAYYCFCTEKRLDILRKDAIRSRQVVKYDNKCRYLTPIQIAEKLAKNNTFCVRFKLEPYTEPFEDMIYGNIHYNVADNEGDPVILKSDGYPTYHLANVVDDHHMKISHVLRGVEWQISTTKHLLLYKAFEWKPPKFGHLPLLINSNGTKLSKRQGDVQISQYRENGILPMALINYVSLAGGGFSRPISSTLCVYSMEDLIEQFDIARINSHPSKLNFDLLQDCNRSEIIRLMGNELTKNELIENVKKIILQQYPNMYDSLEINQEYIEKIVNWSSNRITKLQDLVKEEFSFLWIKPNKKINIDITKDQLDQLISIIEIIPFKKDNIYNSLKQFSKENNIKIPKLMKMLRSGLTGLNDGPSVAEMMEILGKKATIQRISLFKNK